MSASAAALFVEGLWILFGLFRLDMDTNLEKGDSAVGGNEPPNAHIDDEMRRMATIMCASLGTVSERKGW
jgi:hypothetical protein